MEKIFGTQNLKNVVLNTWGADVCAQAGKDIFYCRAFALLI